MLPQVIPTNIENLLMTHPAVKDAAVTGLPDDVDGEIPTAFVVRSPSHPDVCSQELVKFIEGDAFTLVARLTVDNTAPGDLKTIELVRLQSQSRARRRRGVVERRSPFCRRNPAQRRRQTHPALLDAEAIQT